jgi:hypothetical protein
MKRIVIYLHTEDEIKSLEILRMNDINIQSKLRKCLLNLAFEYKMNDRIKECNEEFKNETQ